MNLVANWLLTADELGYFDWKLVVLLASNRKKQAWEYL